MVQADDVLDVLEDLRRHLAWQQAAGGATILSDGRRPPPAAPPEPAQAPPPRAALPPRPAAVPAPAPAARPIEVASARPVAPAPQKTLDEVRRELGDCRRCKLNEGRRHIVYGTGNPRAELVFVGESPGEEEDAQGVPFVGEAGQLLTKMIQAMGYSRDDVYICTVVKCRPPGDRTAEREEVEACEPFLQAQLTALRPKVIVALGKFVAHTLLKETTPISELRGNWREYQGIRLMPTFHPAYLLRAPDKKKIVWSDLQQVMKALGKTARKGDE